MLFFYRFLAVGAAAGKCLFLCCILLQLSLQPLDILRKVSVSLLQSGVGEALLCQRTGNLISGLLRLFILRTKLIDLQLDGFAARFGFFGCCGHTACFCLNLFDLRLNAAVLIVLSGAVLADRRQLVLRA